MKTLFNNYINSFKGLAPEIWILALVTFINRTGAMVIPFLSIYLESEKGFTLPQVGVIMTCFGIGSLMGTYLGGFLTDRIGFYKTIITSLFLGGLGFIGVQFINSFTGLCTGILLLMVAVDTYRPGVYVAADLYGDGKETTRNIGLIRLAINIGFSIGPVIGGFLIAKVSYSSIFWIDGITCIIASILLLVLLKPKASPKEESPDEQILEGIPPLKNTLFMAFFVIMALNSISFVQYFSAVPLYYNEVYHLSEDKIGLLFLINGAMIVIFEMPLIAWLEHLKLSKTMATFWGIALLAISLIILNLSDWVGILVIGMILMTLGEMIGSPFASSLALNMAPKGRKGSYMGLFSISFSISHIIGHNAALNSINVYGYSNTWLFFFSLLALAGLLTLFLKHKLKTSTHYETF